MSAILDKSSLANIWRSFPEKFETNHPLLPSMILAFGIALGSIFAVCAGVIFTPIFFIYELIFTGARWFYIANFDQNPPRAVFDWMLLVWTPLTIGGVALGIALLLTVFVVVYAMTRSLILDMKPVYHFLTRSRASRLWTLCSIFWGVFSCGYITYKLLDSYLLEVVRFANDLNLLNSDIQLKLVMVLGVIYIVPMFVPPIIVAGIYCLGAWVWGDNSRRGRSVLPS